MKTSNMSNQTTWIGTIDNNWFIPDNWTKGLPGLGLHAYIPKLDNVEYYPAQHGMPHWQADYTQLTAAGL